MFTADDFHGESSFKLTARQRVWGFGICFALGFPLSIIGILLLFLGFLSSFAILYTLGTILSLIGTGFLLGFVEQFKLMFKPKRVVATVVLLLAIVIVFVAAFVGSAILALIFVIVEYAAYMWYSFSYVPGARTAVKRFFCA